MSKTKIIRTPTKAMGGITAHEKTAMDALSLEWTQIAMRTRPIDPVKITSAINGLYRAAKLKEPRIVIVPSPLVMAFAGGAASWIWYCRKNAATDAATDNATRAATRAATYAATDAATRDATDAATYAATDAATRAATDAATYAATLAATLAATDAATDAATYAATDAATRAKIEADACMSLAGNGGLRCAALWYKQYQGGNMWAGWSAYLVAFREILGLRLPQYDNFRYYEESSREGGFRLMHDEFCMVSDFPKTILKDDRNRPHCDTGPSHEWRDGWKLYHIHGVRVPDYIVDRPQEITIAKIHAEKNAEVQRVMIERYGEDRYIVDSGMQPVAKDKRFGDIYLKEVEAGKPIAKIRVTNRSPEPDGSYKIYWLNFNPKHYNGDAGRIPQAAVASTWRTKEGGSELFFKRWQDYSPVLET